MEKEQIAELVRQAQAGDMRAMESLLRLAHTSVSYQCRKIMAHAQDAEDMTQEVLLKIYNRLDSLNEPEKFIAWANSIAARRCINERKRNPKDLQFAEDEQGNSAFDHLQDFDEQKVPDAVIDNEETARMIAEIIDALPDAQRTCTYLFYYDQLSVKEIAELLDVSENTVKSRLNYARKAIKAGVEDCEKTYGVKLYGLSPLPFLLYFLRRSAESGADTAAAEAMAKTVLASASPAAVSAAGGVGAAAPAAAGAASSAAGGAAAAGAAVKTAGLLSGISAKATALILAGAVAVGGIAVAVVNEKKQQVAAADNLLPYLDQFLDQDDTAEDPAPPVQDESVIPAYTTKQTVLDADSYISLETPLFDAVSPGYEAINAFFDDLHATFSGGGDSQVDAMRAYLSDSAKCDGSYFYTTTFLLNGQDERYVSVTLSRGWSANGRISYTLEDYTFDVVTGELMSLTDLIDGTEEEIRVMIVEALSAEYGEEPAGVGRLEDYAYEDFRFHVSEGQIWVTLKAGRTLPHAVALPAELK